MQDATSRCGSFVVLRQQQANCKYELARACLGVPSSLTNKQGVRHDVQAIFLYCCHASEPCPRLLTNGSIRCDDHDNNFMATSTVRLLDPTHKLGTGSEYSATVPTTWPWCPSTRPRRSTTRLIYFRNNRLLSRCPTIPLDHRSS